MIIFYVSETVILHIKCLEHVYYNRTLNLYTFGTGEVLIGFHLYILGRSEELNELINAGLVNSKYCNGLFDKKR